MAHCTNDDDLLNIESIQLLLEVSFTEGIDVFFNDDGFLAIRGYCGLNLGAIGPFDKYIGIVATCFVAYVKNGNIGISCMGNYPASIRCSGFNAGQRQFSGRQILILQINNYKTSFHKRSPVKLSN
ncbi:hypothetical protein D3C85_789490 [compost metagenome]